MQYTEELNNMITEFVVAELGTKVIYGITYAFFLNNNKRDCEAFERYRLIRTEANKCGYSTEQLFRIYSLANGHIIDLDISVAKQIVEKIIHYANKYNSMQVDASLFMSNKPEQKREKDMLLLAKNLKSRFDAGTNDYMLALFSRNMSNRIVFNAVNQQNEPIMCAYDAYALRHWDIEALNQDYLIPANFRISRVQPYEILPTKTGVSFNLILESMEKYY